VKLHGSSEDEKEFIYNSRAIPDALFHKIAHRLFDPYHSPVVLIEFDHQHPIALGRSRKAHIHATMRTPNGNEYGKDLFKQRHYLDLKEKFEVSSRLKESECDVIDAASKGLQ
jgi:hypothetical protein